MKPLKYNFDKLLFDQASDYMYKISLQNRKCKSFEQIKNIIIIVIRSFQDFFRIFQSKKGQRQDWVGCQLPICLPGQILPDPIPALVRFIA